MSLGTVPRDQRLTLSWYAGESQTIPTASDVATSDGEPVFVTQVARAGTYFLKANASYQKRASEQNYVLNVGLSTEDRYEVNDTQVEATPISLNEPVQGYSYGNAALIKTTYDTDIYTFDLSQPAPVTVTIDPPPADIAMKLELSDGQNTFINSSRGSTGTRVETVTDVLQPGKYYIKAERNSSGVPEAGSKNPYTLLVKTN